MKRTQDTVWAILFIAGAMIVWFLYQFSMEDYISPENILTASSNGSQVRYPAPDFTLPDLEGNTRQLSDSKGSVVVLMFWTTW